jgi:hypothetical protein
MLADACPICWRINAAETRASSQRRFEPRRNACIPALSKLCALTAGCKPCVRIMDSASGPPCFDWKTKPSCLRNALIACSAASPSESASTIVRYAVTFLHGPTLRMRPAANLRLLTPQPESTCCIAPHKIKGNTGWPVDPEKRKLFSIQRSRPDQRGRLPGVPPTSNRFALHGNGTDLQGTMYHHPENFPAELRTPQPADASGFRPNTLHSQRLRVSRVIGPLLAFFFGHENGTFSKSF